jgi:FixJ family two-component response regulator
MPKATVFIKAQDRNLADRIERLLQVNGLDAEHWNAKFSDHDACGIACLVMEGEYMSYGELDQSSSGLGSVMPVIVISPQGDVPLAVQAIKQGAFDVLEAPLNERALLSMVLRALEQCRQANHMADILDVIRQCMARLTTREEQILQLLVLGKTNKEVALKLKISVRTVEIHRAHVMEKMKVRNMTQLVRMVIAVSDRTNTYSADGFRGAAELPASEAAFI